VLPRVVAVVVVEREEAVVCEVVGVVGGRRSGVVPAVAGGVATPFRAISRRDASSRRASAYSPTGGVRGIEADSCWQRDGIRT